MSKFALCVQRKDVAIDFDNQGVQDIPDGLFEKTTVLMNRSFCETEESLLQLLPYIVLRSPIGRIFCYERGGASGESRLHGRLSIGLGGHVDTKPNGSSLWNHLLAEGERELREETGIEAALGGFGGFEGVIYTGANGNPVDRVHLGLLTQHIASSDEILAEAGIIEHGRFLTLTKVLSPETFDRLEPWSQAVALALRANLSRKIGRTMACLGSMVSLMSIESSTGLTSAASQEVGSVLSALGQNLQSGHAVALVYDEEEASSDVDFLWHCAQELSFDLCKRLILA